MQYLLSHPYPNMGSKPETFAKLTCFGLERRVAIILQKGWLDLVIGPNRLEAPRGFEHSCGFLSVAVSSE